MHAAYRVIAKGSRATLAVIVVVVVMYLLGPAAGGLRPWERVKENAVTHCLLRGGMGLANDQ